MIIAFARTSLAMLARRKDLTRRDWAPPTLRLARRAVESGAPQQAWSNSPRAKGQHIANIRLTLLRESQPTDLMPDEDWEREGFSLMEALGIPIDKHLPKVLWRQWRSATDFELDVVHFELLDITAAGEAMIAEATRIYGPDWMKATSQIPAPLFPHGGDSQ